MPTIPTLTINNPNLNLNDIYNGVYAPSSGSATSLEVLNGGLAETNYGSGKGTIEPWMVQNGTFAQGFYHGFDRWQHMYGYQASNDDDHRIVHAELSTKVFLPWDANVVMYGFQAWFEHDADYLHPTKFEAWFWRLNIKSAKSSTGKITADTNEQQVLQGKLNWGRSSASSYHLIGDFMPEEQWRYVHKSGMLTDVKKGFFTFELDISADLHQLNGDSKIKTPTGGAWVLALR